MLMNKESLYALKIMSYLSKQDRNRIITGREIANVEMISINITLKILRILVKRNIIESFKGIKGGFRMKEKEVSFYEVIKIIQKDIFIPLQKNSEVEKYIHTIQENLKSMLENKMI